MCFEVIRSVGLTAQAGITLVRMRIIEEKDAQNNGNSLIDTEFKILLVSTPSPPTLKANQHFNSPPTPIHESETDSLACGASVLDFKDPDGHGRPKVIVMDQWYCCGFYGSRWSRRTESDRNGSMVLLVVRCD